MWNDTEEPIAYLITFRTYGTWLHGDERGSGKSSSKRFQYPLIRPEPQWLSTNRQRLSREPTILNGRQRATVRKAIIETCRIRMWTMFAVNIRTNHGHAVVGAPYVPPGKVLNALKGNATRLMRERGLWESDKSPWNDKGSTRYLWNEHSVAKAINYVIHGQGEDLPDF